MRTVNFRGVAQLSYRYGSLAQRHHVEVHHVRAFTLEFRGTEEISGHNAPKGFSALYIRGRTYLIRIQGVEIELKPCRLGKSFQEVNVLLLDKEIEVVNGDNCVCARSQPQWLDLDITVKQL